MILRFAGKPWPLGLLLFGLLMLLLAVIGVFTGRTYDRGGRGFYRATEPFNYWLDLVIQCLGAAFLIWAWYTDPSRNLSDWRFKLSRYRAFPGRGAFSTVETSPLHR